MKKDRVKEMSMEIMVGAFMFTVLLALGVLTIILSRENFLATTYPLEVEFEAVQGLRSGDSVLMRGVKVGRVKALQVREDAVHVLVTLDVHFRIHEDYHVEIVPSSILGGQYMAIDAGSPQSPVLAEGTTLQGELPVNVVAEASALVQSIRDSLEGGGVLENLKTMMKQVNDITAKLDQGEGTIGKLLTDETVYNDLRTLTGNLKDVSQRLKDGDGTLAKLLSDDDTIYRDLQQVASNLKEVSERVANGEGTLGRLLAKDSQLYDDISASAAAIRGFSEAMNSGEGTLGKLAKDDTLYEEAKLLMQEIRAAVDDIRETAPITTFTSVFFGAF